MPISLIFDSRIALYACSYLRKLRPIIRNWKCQFIFSQNKALYRSNNTSTTWETICSRNASKNKCEWTTAVREVSAMWIHDGNLLFTEDCSSLSLSKLPVWILPSVQWIIWLETLKLVMWRKQNERENCKKRTRRVIFFGFIRNIILFLSLHNRNNDTCDQIGKQLTHDIESKFISNSYQFTS